MQLLPKIAYIAGCTHSGTTLLNRILGAHPKVISVGGVKNLPKAVAGELQCSCGKAVIGECPFWSEVDNDLKRRGTRLHGLRVNADDDATFKQDNRDLLMSLKAVTGAEVVIDTSRRAPRLRRLNRMDDLTVMPVLLFKDPRTQVGSFRRKGINLKSSLKNYWRENLSVLNDVSSSPNKLILQYEDLCREPDKYVSRIFNHLGLEHDKSILETWGQNDTHMLGGNRMSAQQSSIISLDESWRKRLHGMESMLVSLAGYPVLVSCQRNKMRI